MTLSVVGFFIGGEIKLILISVALLTASVFALFRFVIKKISPYVFLTAILSASMAVTALTASYLYFDFKAKSIEKYYGDYHDVEAIIISERYSGDTLSGYYITVTSIDGKTTYHKATLSCQYPSDFSEGEKISARVFGSGFEDSVGSYNEKRAMFSDGVFIDYLSESVDRMEIIEEKVFLPSIFFKDLNGKVESVFKDNMNESTAAMCSALFLGNRDGLSETVTRDFNRAGAAHILALSGMHMSIIMGFLMLFLKRLRVERKIIAVILSFCAVFYLLLTGFQISAARSVIMLLCVYASWLLSRNPDPLTSLMVAATLLMIIFPGSVIDAAYWMSFAATLGILVYMKPFTDYMGKLLSPYNMPKSVKRLLLKLSSLIAVTLFATVPLIIVLCIFIKQYSFYSIISSIVLGFPTAAIILLSLLFLVLSELWPVSGILANAIGILTDFMTSFCERLSDTENAVISLNYPFIIIIAVIMGAALLFSFASKTRNLFISLIPYAFSVILLVCAISLYNGSMQGKIKVTYINGSSVSDMLLLTDNVGHAVICDIGDSGRSSYYDAVSSMYYSRATEIDAVIVAKYSNNQRNAYHYLFAEEKVRKLWLPYPQNKDDYYSMAALKKVAEQYGVDVSVYHFDEDLRVFENSFINVNGYSIDRSQRPILTVGIITKNDRFTYCSPAFNECAEAEDINYDLERSDFVIFGNYGPKIKIPYSINDNDRNEVISFSDEVLAAYYSENGNTQVKYALVEDICEILLDE